MSTDNQGQILKELEQIKSDWQEKKLFLESEKVKTDSPGKKFELKKEIQKCDEEIKKITEEIESLFSQTKTNLSPIKKVDYTQLENFLAQGKWKEADYETKKIMLEVSGRRIQGWLDFDSVINFPCEDIKKINQLWLKYSNGRFGFSKQIKIYLTKINNARPFNDSKWEELGDYVGWRKNGAWLKYSQITFQNNDNIPIGHLPTWVNKVCPDGVPFVGGGQGWWISFLAHAYDCIPQQEIEKITKDTESFRELQPFNSTNKSQTIDTPDAQDNFKLMEFRDHQEIIASVVFFFIPQLAEQEPNISKCALILLNEILKERLLDTGFKLRILSSIKGAIVVIPDSSGIYIHQHLLVILEDCKNQGIPVRLGITHGELEVLKDADTLFSFIGIPMNVAARLSTSDDNKCILYDSTYINHVQPLPTSKNNDPLHPRYCNDIDIIGKAHDPIFKCREPDDLNLVLSQFDNDILSKLDITSEYFNGIAICYDLPKFSQGDRNELSKRFRSVIDSINSIKNSSIFPEDTNQFFFSPGGDGGILILPIKLDVSLKEYLSLAFELIEKLEVESDSKDPNIDVNSRVGVHSGIIILYQNAEGIPRPTGLTCFIADEIASDDLAKEKGGIIITKKLKGSLYSGSIKRFEREYESLTPLDKGAAKDIQRYAKKLYPLS